MSHSVKVDANHPDQKVNSVTVFQSDRAEVNRRIFVELKAGQNEVEISKLPTVLDQDSIRVDGIGGNAVIFDVIYHPPPPQQAHAHEDALAEFYNKKRHLEEEKAILDFQAKSLKDYGKSLTAEHGDSNKLQEFLEVFAKRTAKINSALNAVVTQLKAVEKEINAEKASLHADEESLKRAVKVTIIVLAQEDGAAELSLTYVVSKASWAPLYDVRANISNDSKTKSTVALHYRASISQSTGEDWTATALTLSTASPQLGSTIPTLTPHWVGEVRPIYQNSHLGYGKKSKAGGSFTAPAMAAQHLMSQSGPIPRMRGGAGFGSPGHIEGSLLDMTDALDGATSAPAFFKTAEATATEGAVSATFGIEGLSTIPSDTKDSSQTHKVSVAVIDLTADLEWIAVPREQPSAFLQAKVKNTSDYLLLPGPANIFLDNNFVSKSRILHVSPNESFSCSLGVDPQLRVTYHPLIRKTKATGGSILTTRSISQTFTQRITVKNTRRTSVRRLIIKDQIPVTTDARIKVALMEPANLINTARKDATIGKGVAVRWVQKEDALSGGSGEGISGSNSAGASGAGDTGEGLIEWVCNIDSGAVVDINLAWEVTAPQGLSWGRQ